MSIYLSFLQSSYNTCVPLLTLSVTHSFSELTHTHSIALTADRQLSLPVLSCHVMSICEIHFFLFVAFFTFFLFFLECRTSHYATTHRSTQHHTALHYTILHHTALYYIMSYLITQCYFKSHHNTTQYNTAQQMILITQPMQQSKIKQNNAVLGDKEAYTHSLLFRSFLTLYNCISMNNQ